MANSTKHAGDGMDPTALAVEQVARLLGVKAYVVRRHIAELVKAGQDISPTSQPRRRASTRDKCDCAWSG